MLAACILYEISRGYVYVGTGNGNIYKIDPDSNMSTILLTTSSGDGFTATGVDEGDQVYFTECYSANSPGTLYCLDGYGLKWSFTPPASKNINIYSGVVSVDIQRNRVYIAYYDSVGQKAYLGCLNRTTGNVIFEREWSNIQYADHSIKSVSLGKDGIIYVAIGSPSFLYAIDPDDFLGSVLWSKDISPGYWLGNTPAIGFKEDNYTTDAIYISYGSGIADDQMAIASLDPLNGETNWTELLDVVSTWGGIGQIYVTGSVNNRIVLVRRYMNIAPGNGYHLLSAFRDNGSSAEELWDGGVTLDAPQNGKTAFGPGATIYSTGSNIIYAHSDGEVGNPYGAGMGFADNSAPSIPANPIPFDGTQDLGSPVTLSWTCSDPEGHALKYDVFLGDATSLMVPVATGLTSTSYTIDGLTEGTAYIWKVVATDGQAVSESPIWAFKTTGNTADINLQPGWNLISLCLQPDDTSIDTVLSSIAGKYVSVWALKNNDWEMYDPENPGFSDLTSIEAGKGYYIYMNQAATLTVTGSSPSNSIFLENGWNLIGYPCCTSVPIEEALESIAGSYTAVWALVNGSWKAYLPATPGLSDLAALEPGLGYWILTTEDCTWIVP